MMAQKSKFDFLGKKAAPRQEEAPPEKQERSSAERKQPPRMGRPAGKRSDPDIVQVTAYIRRATHLGAKRKLLDEAAEGNKREFSELVEDLLAEWLRER
jgi:hypothetical protein